MKEPTMHWTKATFDDPHFIHGFTLTGEGAAQAYIAVETLNGERFFASSPLVEYPDREMAINHMFPIPNSAYFAFPEPFICRAITLFHRSTNGMSYTIRDIQPSSFASTLHR